MRQGQRLDAPGHSNRKIARQDAVRSDADAHQPRRAHAVYRHTGHRVGQAAGVGTQATDVVALGTLLRRRAHDHVPDVARLDSGPLDHRAYDMAAEHRRLGVIEGTAKRLAQRRPGSGNDHDIIGIHAQAHCSRGLKV